MKIGWVALVKPSHPYLENGPAPLVDLHYLRISPWLWFSPNPPMGGVKAGQIGMREPTREKAWAPLGPM